MMTFFALFFFIIITINILWSTCQLGITPTPSNTLMRKSCLHLLNTVTQQLLNTHSLQQPPNIVIAGSGWGGLAFFLARHNQGALICYEAAFIPWFFSRCLYSIGRLFQYYPDTIQIIRKNTIHMNVPAHSILICYLYPEGTQKLYSQMTSLTPKPIGLISIAFAVNHISAPLIMRAKDWMNTPIYWYPIISLDTLNAKNFYLRN